MAKRAPPPRAMPEGPIFVKLSGLMPMPCVAREGSSTCSAPLQHHLLAIYVGSVLLQNFAGGSLIIDHEQWSGQHDAARFRTTKQGDMHACSRPGQSCCALQFGNPPRHGLCAPAGLRQVGSIILRTDEVDMWVAKRGLSKPPYPPAVLTTTSASDLIDPGPDHPRLAAEGHLDSFPPNPSKERHVHAEHGASWLGLGDKSETCTMCRGESEHRDPSGPLRPGPPKRVWPLISDKSPTEGVVKRGRQELFFVTNLF